MNPLRLCFVGPADNVTLRRWVQWFSRQGHDTTILTVEPAGEADRIGFTQVDLNGVVPSRKVTRCISAVRMTRTIRALNPDVVHVHYARGLAWGLAYRPFHPTVVTPWGSDVLEEQGAFREWYSKWLTQSVVRRADLVAVHSDYLESKIRLLCPDVTSIVRIGWGVDLNRFRPGLAVKALRERWKIPAEAQVVFSPRLAQRFYNHHVIIEALGYLRETVPDVVLAVVEQRGDAAYVNELRSQVQRLGLADHVRFVGSIPYDDMPCWFNLATAVVQVPESDGMPNTLLEAMACGAVPVLRQLPQYQEVIRDDVNGKYVSEAPRSIAAGLAAVLGNGEMRRRIVATNQAVVREIADQEKEMRRMESHYYALAHRVAGRAA